MYYSADPFVRAREYSSTRGYSRNLEQTSAGRRGREKQQVRETRFQLGEIRAHDDGWSSRNFVYNYKVRLSMNSTREAIADKSTGGLLITFLRTEIRVHNRTYAPRGRIPY